MTAVTDLTTVLTILKGSVPTNAQIGKVVAVIAPDAEGTNEQKAAATIAAMRAGIRAKLRQPAEDEVYAAVIRQAHLPADQPALLAAAQPTAIAAGDAAEAEL
jgi:hypothetical protein